MGCGRSRLQIFQSTSASKKKKKKKQQEMVVENVENMSVEEITDFDVDSPEAATARRAAAVARFRQISQGPLLAMADVSRSQTEFFRMLDEKIESGPDIEFYDDHTPISPSQDGDKPRRLSLLNGHRSSINSIKFHSQGMITSSPTRCRTPQTSLSPKHRLPPLQASPPPRDPNRRSSPTHILSLALASPLKISQGTPRMFGSNKIFKSEELANRYD